MSASTSQSRDRTSEFLSLCERLQRQYAASTSGASAAERGPLLPSRRLESAEEKSEFARRASRIGLGIHQVSQKLQRLSQLARQTSMFNDPAQQINELTAVVKSDLQSLNGAITDLQNFVATGTSGVGSKQSKTHSATGDIALPTPLTPAPRRCGVHDAWFASAPGLLQPWPAGAPGRSVARPPSRSGRLAAGTAERRDGEFPKRPHVPHRKLEAAPGAQANFLGSGAGPRALGPTAAPLRSQPGPRRRGRHSVLPAGHGLRGRCVRRRGALDGSADAAVAGADAGAGAAELPGQPGGRSSTGRVHNTRARGHVPAAGGDGAGAGRDGAADRREHGRHVDERGGGAGAAVEVPERHLQQPVAGAQDSRGRARLHGLLHSIHRIAKRSVGWSGPPVLQRAWRRAML